MRRISGLVACGFALDDMMKALGVRVLLILCMGASIALATRCSKRGGTCQDPNTQPCTGRFYRGGCGVPNLKCCASDVDSRCQAKRFGVCQNESLPCDGWYSGSKRMCRHHAADVKCCVPGCIDGSKRRDLGETWIRENLQGLGKRSQCSCAFPAFAELGPMPAIICTYLGCEDPDTNRFREPGETIVNSQGLECTCVEGPDPNLGDAGSLYHWECTIDIILCEADEYMCGLDDGCIPQSRVCDGQADCTSTADEGAQCVTCQDFEFQCNNGFCVNSSLVCDDSRDCADGSDELFCESCTGDDGYMCDSGQCVHPLARCNQFVQCPDLSDEIGCGGCSSFHFPCTNGLCIFQFQACDGIDHCLDNSDEENCACDGDEAECTDGSCIKSGLLCDGNVDCRDESDELGCDTCTSAEFTCADYACVEDRVRCDGVADCSDGSDEENCVTLGRPPSSSLSGIVFIGAIPVCASGWTDFASDALCKQLGFGPLTSTTRDTVETSDRYFELDSDFDGSGYIQGSVLSSSCDNAQVVEVTCANSGCGVRSGTNEWTPFIIGGRLSLPAAWPWLVAIWYLGIKECGGAVIHPQWVLTAAHCIPRGRFFEYYEIWVGFNNVNNPGEFLQRRRLAGIFMHPDFRTADVDAVPDFNNDIALMLLDSPLVYSSHVQPICLPDSDDTVPLTANCFVAGWGAIQAFLNFGANDLREGKLPIWPDDACVNSWQVEFEYTFGLLCAGYSTGRTSSCVGDSGGPLMCFDRRGFWYQAGIVSVGEDGCRISPDPANPVKPVAYARPTVHRDWIDETIANNTP